MAISANELRIGNWVNFAYKYKGEYLSRPCQVISISEGQIIVLDKGVSLASDFQPIPLTPEILGYLGFVDTKARLAGNPDRIIEWSNGDYEIIRDGDDDYYLVLATDEYGDAIKTIEIKYAHRLQNVIFALTQTELTYSPHQ